MTTLEIILLAILWVIYGLFTAYQITNEEDSDDVIIGIYFLLILLSPIVLIIRIIIGIFHSKTIK
jgi:hypothetical protein